MRTSSLFLVKDYFFLLSFILIGFIPYFKTIDIIGSQWFYLSVLNFVYLGFNLIQPNFISFLCAFFKNIPSKFFLIFFIFVSLSLLYTNNFNLSLVDYSRIIIVYLSIINISFYFHDKNFNILFFSYCISSVLFLEVVYSFLPLLRFLLFESDSIIDLDFQDLAYSLKGIAGNKNITASNISFKLPFVFIIFYKSTRFFKIIASFLFYFSLLLIYLLSARATYISLFFSLFLFSLFFFYFKLNDYRKFSLYYLLPILFFFLSINYISSLNNSSIANSKLTNFEIVDESSSNRFILYENALDYISKNPLIGCGIGNWKIESLPYWKSLMTGYIVPYHAHNDFLELATEIGILGSLSYLFIFIFLFMSSLISFIMKNNIFSVLILSLVIVYFIDAFLNFPLERALSQVNFIVLFVLFYLKPSDD